MFFPNGVKEMTPFLTVAVILVACARRRLPPFPFTIEVCPFEPTIDISNCSTIICCSDYMEVDVDRVIDVKRIFLRKIQPRST